MLKKTNIIKRAISNIGLLLLSLCAFTSNAQTFQSEISNFNKLSIDSYVSTQPNLSKKIPIKLSDVSPAQLSDKSIPNSLEINEINKYIQQRDRNLIEYGKIVRKYIKPSEAAEAIIKIIEKHWRVKIVHLYCLEMGK